MSDIHANVYALETVILEARRLDFDEVIFIGDMFGYYPWVRETWDLWSSWEVNKHQLAGNHDMLVISGTAEEIAPYEPAISVAREQLPREALDHLRALSPCGTFEGIACYHGSPVDPFNGRVYPDTSADVFMGDVEGDGCLGLGHTHYPMERTCGKTIIINPGSVGQPRDGDARSSCATVDTTVGDVRFYRIVYDISGVMDKLSRMHWPDAFIQALDKGRRRGAVDRSG